MSPIEVICTRCKATPESDKNKWEFPEGWTHVIIRPARVVPPHKSDLLCPTCAKGLIAYMTIPDELEKIVQQIKDENLHKES